ncbi:TRAP transporter small permease [Vibrio atypicus]|jgi:TRAP-type C4-dicarboxylate transport system permease small subunit|uniref:TRAP transporter small permease n=1 Tax=Vibrio atypicus TaxID=558271 RepID=UPI00135BE96A|nr:TRAP transporter small permease [Vibrio atypicus]
MSGFRFSKAIERGLGSLAALSLFLMMVVTFVDVASRNLLNAPIMGSTEMVEILLAIMVFMAFPLVSWQEENICVDLLDNYFPSKWVSVRQIIINLICACSLILVATTNWKLAGRSLEYEEVSEILEMPLGYVTYLISTTGFIGGLLTLFNAFYYTKQMFSNKPSESDMSIKGKEA